MTNTPHIEIPRLPGERNERYQARVAYVTMGPDRSLRLVGQTLGKSAELMERWSSADNWTEHARKYDEAVAHLVVQDAAESYRKEIREHRERARKGALALYGVALEMLSDLRAARKTMEYTPAALATIMRAMTEAVQLEAYTLTLIGGAQLPEYDEVMTMDAAELEELRQKIFQLTSAGG